MTQETSVTAIVLSIIFTSVLVLIILAVVIIVKLSRKINCKHRSESDGSVRSQLLLVESDGLQEDDVKFNNYNNACMHLWLMTITASMHIFLGCSRN